MTFGDFNVDHWQNGTELNACAERPGKQNSVECWWHRIFCYFYFDSLEFCFIEISHRIAFFQFKLKLSNALFKLTTITKPSSSWSMVACNIFRLKYNIKIASWNRNHDMFGWCWICSKDSSQEADLGSSLLICNLMC